MCEVPIYQFNVHEAEEATAVTGAAAVAYAVNALSTPPLTFWKNTAQGFGTSSSTTNWTGEKGTSQKDEREFVWQMYYVEDIHSTSPGAELPVFQVTASISVCIF